MRQKSIYQLRARRTTGVATPEELEQIRAYEAGEKKKGRQVKKLGIQTGHNADSRLVISREDADKILRVERGIEMDAVRSVTWKWVQRLAPC